MPWKETCAMNERLKFVADNLEQDQSISELCRHYGISRPTAYKWIERYDQFGPEGLLEKGCAPKHHPNQTPADIEAKLVALKNKYRKWGPRKLLTRLKKKEPHVSWPALSTAGAILKRRGLTIPRKHRARTPPYQGLCHTGATPNDVWAADFKGWFKTRDGHRVDPLTITDWFSRYLICCQAVESTKGLPVKMQFERAFREYGMPWAIRTDNGPPFASIGLGGLSRLSVWWIRLGIWPERIRPGHPEENGRHERMHKTLKEYTIKPPCYTACAQQMVFNRFQQEYNEERPHESLEMQTPSEWYQTSDRTFPNRLPEIEYGHDFVIRRVRSDGQIKWQGKMLFMSESLIGEFVGLRKMDDEIWTIHFGPLVLATYSSQNQKLCRVVPSVNW